MSILPVYKPLPEQLSQTFYDAVFQMITEYAMPAWFATRPTEPQPINLAERVEGLAAIWAEAKASFAYWDERPDLDWDAAFRTYIPRVCEAEEPREYYTLLQEFAGLLREGHSYVAPPPWLPLYGAGPAVGIRPVEGRPTVVRGEALPLGTVVTGVDGRPIEAVVEECSRRVFASTAHDRLAKACAFSLWGPKGTDVAMDVRLPDGTDTMVVLPRTGGLPPRPLFERRELGDGLVYVSLNSWADPAVVDQFHQAFPNFEGVRGLIIDQRYNGGGNYQFGEAILGRLIDREVPTEIDSSPIYWGAMRAAGLDRLMLVTREQPVRPDTSRPRFGGPVAVLTSISTYSAAENFCLAFRNSQRGLLIGEPTAGSTGNPAMFPLPGGGVGAISAMKVTCLDGTPLIGVGLQPDIAVAPTLAGVAAGRDEVLERAGAALSTLLP